MHFYGGLTPLGSPGDHLYAFLRGVHSPGSPLGSICMHLSSSPGGHLYVLYVFFTLIPLPRIHLYAFLRGARSPELHWAPCVCIFTWCTLAWEAFVCIYVRLAPLNSPGVHLYAFLRGVHSPGLPWGPQVYIFT